MRYRGSSNSIGVGIACAISLPIARPATAAVELGVVPGDSACVRGGPREFLRHYDSA